MKKILIVALLIVSANAKWESAHMKDGELVLFNPETGQSYKEYFGVMVPLGFSTGTEIIDDPNGKKIVVPIYPYQKYPIIENDPKKVGSK